MLPRFEFITLIHNELCLYIFFLLLFLAFLNKNNRIEKKRKSQILEIIKKSQSIFKIISYLEILNI